MEELSRLINVDMSVWLELAIAAVVVLGLLILKHVFVDQQRRNVRVIARSYRFPRIIVMLAIVAFIIPAHAFTMAIFILMHIMSGWDFFMREKNIFYMFMIVYLTGAYGLYRLLYPRAK